MKRAFTLIELLVVIAIIAILAAILFPVFAQAKEAAKKTANLSDVKQTGTATAVYTADTDDNYPIAGGVDANGNVEIERYNGIPAGWDSVAQEPGDIPAWGNSVQSYMKNYELLEAKGAPKVQMNDVFGAAAYANPRKKPVPTALVMNGLLNAYSGTAVTEPSKLVVFWYGYGKENEIGAINLNPALNCGLVKECRFNPNGMPATSAYNGTTGDIVWSPYNDSNDSVWIYGQGQNMSRADTSAKYYRLGGTGGERRNVQDPFNTYGRKGEYWLSVNRCSLTAGGTRYVSFFRPDNEFRHQFGATALCLP